MKYKIKRIIKYIGVIAIILLLSFNVQKIIEWKKDSKETKNIIETITPKIIKEEHLTEETKIINKDIV